MTLKRHQANETGKKEEKVSTKKQKERNQGYAITIMEGINIEITKTIIQKIENKRKQNVHPLVSKRRSKHNT